MPLYYSPMVCDVCAKSYTCITFAREGFFIIAYSLALYLKSTLLYVLANKVIIKGTQKQMDYDDLAVQCAKCLKLLNLQH